MDSLHPEVNEAVSLIDSIELPHPSGALLSSFITEALDPRTAAKFVLASCRDGHSDDTRADLLSLVDDWTYIVESISKHGNPPPAPDHAIRQAIMRRDGARCCITGSSGRLWDPLIVEPILPVPSRWVEPTRPNVLDMLGAFFGRPYRDWWLDYSQNPGFTMPYYNHWLVKKSAARAFSRGVIKLDRLQPSMVEYEVLQTPLGPEDPIQVHGSYALLGDHSRAGNPTVDARFVGTHARLCKSVQLLELSDMFSPTSDVSKTKQRSVIGTSRLLPWVSYLTQPLFSSLLAAWLLIPTRVRLLAYRTLRRSAQRFIEPDCDTVQRLPFGLYLKSARDLDSLRNEVNALRTVGSYTSVPVPKALDFVTAPTPASAQDDLAHEEGYLLMNRIPGVPLSRCQEVLSDKDAARIEAQLQDHITQLRAIPQPAGTGHAISDTLGGACRDTRIKDGEPVGPFADEASFNQELGDPRNPARSGHHIFFTHADLNPRNILVDRTAQRDGSLGWQVTGIVDWEMAGYYPEYWEYTKALYERFRWTRRYQNMVHRVFRLFGDYSKEFDLELSSWESGM